ncbi:MAG TPA: hypothetical protein VGX22_08955 [Candidatus Dormibacteraeota bacterium]|nr:hypothetical protein [Candidatus Dormibacteraeota bacterium]
MSADPAAGAIIGTFLLAAYLAGPVGWALALIAWAVMRRGKTRDPAGGQRAR